MRRTRRSSLLGIAALLALVAGCGDAGDSRPTTAEYSTSATVLADRTHGPQLCWVVAESFPPQCGGPDIAGWDWSDVEAEQTHAGTTWGEFTVVGMFDGRTFTVTRPPRRSTPAERQAVGTPPTDFRSRCGLLTARPGPRTRAVDLAAARRAAARSPFVGAVWVTPQAGPDMLNVRFARDAAALERDLRRLYAGPLCVTEGGPARAKLRRVAREVFARRTELFGPNAYLGSGALEVDGVVEATVVWDPGGAQRVLDERYGSGLVRVTPLLRPITRA